ncbi:MAG: urease accessory protein UreD [Janthinobacterium lividum]
MGHAPCDTPDTAPERSGWPATLSLGFAMQPTGRSALVRRLHAGPLQVQRPLYPEGPRICHAVIVHPPGGIAGGDTLAIDVHVGAGAHAVLATPGASKWYKANGRSARQSIEIHLADGAHLDWLPQNNIVFDQAQVETSFTLHLAPGASAIGWDATQLGRQAAGERWRKGWLRSVSQAQFGTQKLWAERVELTADDPQRHGLHGLHGYAAFGTLWAFGAHCTSELAQTLAASLPFDGSLRAGATALSEGSDALPGAIIVRVLGDSMQAVQACLVQAWTLLREPVLGVPAQPLRLWRT